MRVEVSLDAVAVVGEVSVSVDGNSSVIVAACSAVDVSEGICVLVVGLCTLCVVAAVVPLVNISSAVKVDVSGISVVSFTSGVSTGPDLGRSGRKGGVVVVTGRSGISVLFGAGGLLISRSG